jgi:hypothetical protein
MPCLQMGHRAPADLLEFLVFFGRRTAGLENAGFQAPNRFSGIFGIVAGLPGHRPLGAVVLVSGAVTTAPQPTVGTFARFPRISANQAPTRSMPIFTGFSRLWRFARFPRAILVLVNADGPLPQARSVAMPTGPGGVRDHGAE